jgi:hypothetical protein
LVQSKKGLTKPGKMAVKTPLNKHFRRSAKTIKAVGDRYYRRDLQGAALARFSLLKRCVM